MQTVPAHEYQTDEGKRMRHHMADPGPSFIIGGEILSLHQVWGMGVFETSEPLETVLSSQKVAHRDAQSD